MALQVGQKFVCSQAVPDLKSTVVKDTHAADIIMSSEADFVNKGGASEMFAGLELIKYNDCFSKPDLHYWQRISKNSQAEVDYVVSGNGKVLPIEVKANTQGSMQSLWIFMRGHNLTEAIRTSLENFGTFIYVDAQAENTERHVSIIPLYALSILSSSAVTS